MGGSFSSKLNSKDKEELRKLRQADQIPSWANRYSAAEGTRRAMGQLMLAGEEIADLRRQLAESKAEVERLREREKGILQTMVLVRNLLEKAASDFGGRIGFAALQQAQHRAADWLDPAWEKAKDVEVG